MRSNLVILARRGASAVKASSSSAAQHVSRRPRCSISSAGAYANETISSIQPTTAPENSTAMQQRWKSSKIPSREAVNGSWKDGVAHSSSNPSLLDADGVQSNGASNSNNNNNNSHSNPAVAYENRHSSDGNIGFNIRDGPVPINQTARAKARSKRRGRTASATTGDEALHGHANGLSESLIDPFYVPLQSDQTHLIQGGTPCDAPSLLSPNSPPYTLATYGEESVYTLILLRHGESEWNSQNRYTGWCDVSLTKRGEMEARSAGRLLYENGIEIDHAFTSVLRRASFTCNMCLNMAKQHWVPITKTWRLNERHYGALQGYNKDTAYDDLNIDQELVMEMRRSYATPPPRMEDDHPYWHGNDRRYSKLTEEQLEKSRAESLKDAAERIMPFF
mmetsp:Transcript_10857/g.23911  ORF Transcript_10857/g.23911 Transcript_10857/m.23911 type:complete len:392 (-) Transcript_10857:11-1186(-)